MMVWMMSSRFSQVIESPAMMVVEGVVQLRHQLMVTLSAWTWLREQRRPSRRSQRQVVFMLMVNKSDCGGRRKRQREREQRMGKRRG